MRLRPNLQRPRGGSLPSILYRLAEALQPDYEVEREIASGGMGSVFAARDVALDRLVAVKIIKPELSTAEAAERFVQEAKVLAQVRHPNVVPVHKAGEAAGFFYYIMDFMEGETLAARLKRGTLSPDEVVNLGRDLLHAIEAVHALGVVHRDIKPANIFLSGDRALLADFGISRASGPQTAEGQPGEVVSGTPGYMPPEQAFGWDITERTDLYAIAMVLYEALTGRRWDTILPEKPADWSGVTRRLAPMLRRALDFDPRMRWPDARSFRRALWRTRTTKYRRRTLMLTLAGLTAGAVAAVLVFGGRGALPTNLAILPFDVEGTVSRQDGVDVATIVHNSLVALDPAGFTYTRRLSEAGMEPMQILERVNAPAYVSATVRREGDVLAVQMSLTDREGNRYEASVIDAPSVGEFDGCMLGNEVVQLLVPGAEYTCPPTMGSDAVEAWLRGENAFSQQDWAAAEDHFLDALRHDSTFVRARWRLVNTRRWLRVHQSLDLFDRLYREQADQLSELDRMLLDAWRQPFGRERLEKYRQAVEKYPRDPYAWLLFGDDLLMRGPLLGISIDSAVAALNEATALDSAMAPAYLDLSWAAIRTGRRQDAESALLDLYATAVGNAEVTATTIEWARAERFDTAAAKRMRGAVVTSPEVARAFASTWLRWGLSFDVPASQADVAGGFLLMPHEPDVRATLFAARALALFELGQARAAVPLFDSVASMLDSPEARLHAAQWRVLPAELNAPALAEVELVRGRQVLEDLATDSDVATRAAWTLAVDAYARDAHVDAQEWVDIIRADTTPEARDLEIFLDGANFARLREWERALAVTADLVPYEADRAADPFLRSALYLSRAQWRTQLNDPEVDGAWLWYENSDLIGNPAGLPQSGEIDWAFSAFARFHRGKAALGRGDTALGCSLLSRVLELWTNADPAYQPLVTEAEELTDARCPA